MSALSTMVTGFLTARAKKHGKSAIGITAAMTGYRMFRRLTKPSTKPLMRFEVKPGEVYEISGTRRGQ